jgi:hypothetical protein
MKYDEKFIYFLVNKKNLNFDKDKLYIPIDTTPKTGSSYCENFDLLFDKAADFLIVIDGKKDSRVMVQERYESLRSTYSENVYQYNTYEKENIPDKDSPKFKNIDMILQTATPLIYGDLQAPAEVFETGNLTYGNANPESEDFNSLADFNSSGDYIEIKLPWQILNFSDPSRMTIHDDYFDNNFGIEYISIDNMNVGLSSKTDERRISLKPFELKGWENSVKYHERLKSSYYMLQKIWSEK